MRLLVTWTLLHAYVVWRASSVPLLRRVRWVWWLAGGVVLWLPFPLARLLPRNTPRPIAAPLEIVGTTWLGFLFLALVCLLVVEIGTGFGFLLRRVAPRLRGGALVAAGLLSVLALVQASRAPVVTRYEVVVPGLPADADGLVVVALADFHLGTMRSDSWLVARVAQANALRPDLIVILGDLIDGRGEIEWDPDLVPALRELSAPLGVWAILGNHERHDPEPSAAFLAAAGMHVLRDGWGEVRPGLILAGAEDPGNGKWSVRDVVPHVERALAGLPKGGAVVLLDHRPQAADVAARGGAGLMLSGHTHGGQLWPMTWVASAVYPLVEGRYEVEGMPILVTRGAGTWGPRMRLWRRGEILVIRLRAPAGAR